MNKLFQDIEQYLKENKDIEIVNDKLGQILTEDEVEKVILALAAARGEESFTEEEVFELVKWAEKVRIEESLLSLLLDGLVNIDLRDGEPVFMLNDEGKVYIESESDYLEK
jgi:hypothetical protein